MALTGRRQAYFTDYAGTANEFASMARHGTLYQGQFYSWQKKPRGGYAFGLPSRAFVCFLENHDQVANTGLGWRLYHHTDAAKWRAMVGLLLLGPQLPMLFQGAEFAAAQPFTYFADLDGDLAAAVRKGRLEFLSQFPELQQPNVRDLIPRPDDRAAFERCGLQRDARGGDKTLPEQARALHRDLIEMRRTDPVLSRLGTADVTIESSAPGSRVLLIRYLSALGDRLVITNFGDDHRAMMNDPLFAAPPDRPWKLTWTSDDPAYGGVGAVPFLNAGRWLLRGLSTALLVSEAAD